MRFASLQVSLAQQPSKLPATLASRLTRTLARRLWRIKGNNMRIIDLLDIAELSLEKIKIHLATGSQDRHEALHEFFNGSFKQWQEWQNHKNFERDYILSFVQVKNNEWLFVGIFKKIDVIKKSDGYHYVTELTQYGNDLIGRLTVKFEKDFRQSYITAEKYIEKFEIIEILREKMVMDNFPGYENVCIDYPTLQAIIRIDEKTWHTALSSVTGIYLICDGNNGKLYIGSATGEENFWQRWSDYAKTFDGGNIELKEVKERHNKEYLDNFTYSIIEIYSLKTDKQVVIDREYYWQKILKTNEFGYNHGNKSLT